LLTLTPQEIAQVVEAGEALALKDAYGALASYRPEMGTSIEEVDGAVCCVLRTVPSTMFNRVLKFGLDAPASEASLDLVRGVFEPHDLPFAIQLSPSAGLEMLKGWLDERGFVITTNWVKFYRDVAPPAEIQTDLRIVLAGIDDRETYGRVMAQGFGAPDMLRPWFEAALLTKSRNC
jgi:hypothetical protein